ncbi:2-keto-3-deoxygluconate permease, partial [Escherichia coli]|nr:2-keto-3-deoxygluconate permease [Escherichia coli]
DPSLAEVVTSAAPLIAASVITTAILTPVLTSRVAKNRARQISEEKKV